MFIIIYYNYFVGMIYIIFFKINFKKLLCIIYIEILKMYLK